jgi:hypothetical protein
LNVETVLCGRQSAGSLMRRNTFSVPEMFIAVSRMIDSGNGRGKVQWLTNAMKGAKRSWSKLPQ